jgi:hypothetical protein
MGNPPSVRHATLMDQRGLYRELYEIQARAYG